ncbi:hypothetical protein AV530_018484 [Patagioenas fasciata monilis]|uniref:Uncharacterized protein n=1 Tax=Patagioenas fasciata monilis TaxID=372326 RepID=A0A1V4JS77_PATFA|nr:hypothetical protein AV530_018484 [Patagioenas fasciata monilis]
MASCEAAPLAIVVFSGVPSETAQRGGNPEPVARQYQPKGNEKSELKELLCKADDAQETKLLEESQALLKSMSYSPAQVAP